MTRNEARESLGLLPLSGGDIATVDINVGTVPLTAFDKPVGQAEVAEVIANEDDQVVGEVGDDDAGDPVSPTNDVQATKEDRSRLEAVKIRAVLISVVESYKLVAGRVSGQRMIKLEIFGLIVKKNSLASGKIQQGSTR